MKVELIKNDRLRVWLSDEELVKWGVDYASLEGGTPQTDRLIRQVLRAAQRHTGRPVEHCAVEAFPVDGGCVLLLTLSRVQLRPDEPLICRLSDTDTLYALAERFATVGALPRSSLYEMPWGYILVIHTDEKVTAIHRRLLSEYGYPAEGGEAAVAAAGEYGTLLAASDALEKLTVRAPQPPEPTAPER